MASGEDVGVTDGDKLRVRMRYQAYRSIEAVAVVVQQALFLQKIELNPVVETRDLPSFDLS